MEIVDIVDKDLNVLYQATKQKAHEEGLLHKCVIAEVINSEGKMMLIRPNSHKQDAGQYVSPVGGHVTAGETDEEALKREVEEEIGIKSFTHKIKGKAIFDRHVLGRHENHYFILYEIFTDEVPQLGDEAESYAYFSKDELKRLLKENPQDFGDAFHFVVKTCFPEFLS